VDSWNALLASLSERSEKFDERRRERPPIAFAGCRRLRGLESSMVKALRSGVPTFDVEGSSSAMNVDVICSTQGGEM